MNEIEMEPQQGDARGLWRDLRSLGEVRAPATIKEVVLARTGLSDGYALLETPIGPLYVVFNRRAALAVLRAADDQEAVRLYQERFGRQASRAEPPAWLTRQVTAGGRAVADRLRLEGLSEFERAVLLKALEIPKGEVRTYAWVANEIGRPGAVRAVGSALGRNPLPLLIPCHRVVRSDGNPGDYVFGASAKRSVLEQEGVDLASLETLGKQGLRFAASDTTRIYCFPTCRNARRITQPHLKRFATAAQAEAAGYRACKVCRPAVAV